MVTMVCPLLGISLEYHGDNIRRNIRGATRSYGMFHGVKHQEIWE